MRIWMSLLLTVLFTTSLRADEDFATRLMRATVKIVHDKSTATGFVLTRGDTPTWCLITAAHVFEQIPDDEATLQFRRQESDGDYQKELMKLAIRKQGAPLWTKHPNEDLAALIITPPAVADLPRLTTQSLGTDDTLRSAEVGPGDRVLLLGYPHRNESNDAGFAILRAGAVASFPLLPTAKTRSFLFSGNSFEGDSGGPVIWVREGAAMNKPRELILGLVVGQRFLDEEAKLIYGTTKIRHRLGLAIVIHASLILETIERLPR